MILIRWYPFCCWLRFLVDLLGMVLFTLITLKWFASWSCLVVLFVDFALLLFDIVVRFTNYWTVDFRFCSVGVMLIAHSWNCPGGVGVLRAFLPLPIIRVTDVLFWNYSGDCHFHSLTLFGDVVLLYAVYCCSSFLLGGITLLNHTGVRDLITITPSITRWCFILVGGTVCSEPAGTIRCCPLTVTLQLLITDLFSVLFILPFWFVLRAVEANGGYLCRFEPSSRDFTLLLSFVLIHRCCSVEVIIVIPVGILLLNGGYLVTIDMYCCSFCSILGELLGCTIAGYIGGIVVVAVQFYHYCWNSWGWLLLLYVVATEVVVTMWLLLLIHLLFLTIYYRRWLLRWEDTLTVDTIIILFCCCCYWCDWSGVLLLIVVVPLFSAIHRVPHSFIVVVIVTDWWYTRYYIFFCYVSVYYMEVVTVDTVDFTVVDVTFRCLCYSSPLRPPDDSELPHSTFIHLLCGGAGWYYRTISTWYTCGIRCCSFVTWWVTLIHLLLLRVEILCEYLPVIRCSWNAVTIPCLPQYGRYCVIVLLFDCAMRLFRCICDSCLRALFTFVPLLNCWRFTICDRIRGAFCRCRWITVTLSPVAVTRWCRFDLPAGGRLVGWSYYVDCTFVTVTIRYSFITILDRIVWLPYDHTLPLTDLTHSIVPLFPGILLLNKLTTYSLPLHLFGSICYSFIVVTHCDYAFYLPCCVLRVTFSVPLYIFHQFIIICCSDVGLPFISLRWFTLPVHYPFFCCCDDFCCCSLRPELRIRWYIGYHSLPVWFDAVVLPRCSCDSHLITISRLSSPECDLRCWYRPRYLLGDSSLPFTRFELSAVIPYLLLRFLPFVVRCSVPHLYILPCSVTLRLPIPRWFDFPDLFGSSMVIDYITVGRYYDCTEFYSEWMVDCRIRFWPLLLVLTGGLIVVPALNYLLRCSRLPNLFGGVPSRYVLWRLPIVNYGDGRW